MLPVVTLLWPCVKDVGIAAAQKKSTEKNHNTHAHQKFNRAIVLKKTK